MMRLGWLLLYTASAASECPAEKAEQAKGVKGVALVQRATNLARQLAAQVPDLDHAHIVCHSQGCEEVQASLEVVREGTKAAQAKLQQCATTRSALERDLKKVAASRANVTAALEKCATERAELQARVEKCGKHRAETEAALAKCASERAALEAELHQCAAVDRPAAEKALAECGVARAKLEAELKELEKRLASGGSRRRSGSRRRKESLMETNSSVDDSVDEESDASLEAKLMQVRKQLSIEKAREVGLNAELAELMERMEAAKELLDSNDGEFDELVQQLGLNQDEASELLEKTKSLSKRIADALAENGQLDMDMSALSQSVKDAIRDEMAAASDLLGRLKAHAEHSNNLLSMTLSEKEGEEVELRKTHQTVEAKIAALQEEIKRKDDDHEECDDVRADLVKAKGTLASTALKLKECLAAKEVLNKKIAAATEADKKASEGLRKCLATKTKLKAALEECESKCEETGKLLQECLARKKVLTKKIKECHDARDLARKKLQECLDRKEELQQKIEELQEKLNGMGLIESKTMQDQTMTLSSAVHAVLGMLNEVSKAEKTAEKLELVAGNAETNVESIETSIGQAISSALDATKDQQDQMSSALSTVGQLQSTFDDVTSSLDDAESNDEQANTETDSIG